MNGCFSCCYPTSGYTAVDSGLPFEIQDNGNILIKYSDGRIGEYQPHPSETRAQAIASAKRVWEARKN